MRFTLVGAALGLFSALVEAQTFTDCNPLKRCKSSVLPASHIMLIREACPPDPALGKAASFDFTNGPFNDFKEVGNPTYGADGAAFTISRRGEAPLIQSNWYIMFGRVEMVVKAAPGTGIVSSGVLQSDDLDEIDWEWLGANNNQVQTNYFGKGNTQSYSRGAWHDAPNNHDVFHTYTIDWSSTQLVWQIDGKTVRVVTPETAEGQYPQSPMMVKVGIWSGGDPGNAQGTIRKYFILACSMPGFANVLVEWAGGETDYSAGPFTMYLKSLDVTDYSTGSSYSYSDKSGSWQSIRSEGGQVNGNINEKPNSVTTTPPVTTTVDSVPIPWDGTHRETSTFEPPNVWPWVPTTFSSSVPTMTSVPSGWAVSGTGQVQPPSAASVSEHPRDPLTCRAVLLIRLLISLPSSQHHRLHCRIRHPPLALTIQRGQRHPLGPSRPVVQLLMLRAPPRDRLSHRLQVMSLLGQEPQTACARSRQRLVLSACSLVVA